MREWINAHPTLFTVVFLGGFALLLWPVGRFVKRLAGVTRPGQQPLSLTQNPKVGLAFGGVFLVSGLFMLTATTLRPISRVRRAAHWPTTQGTVLRSAIGDTEDGDGSPQYRPEVRYGYVVDGRSYAGETYDATAGMYSGNRKTAEDVVLARPVGKTVDVFYDPADPSQALLNRNTPVAVLWLGPFSLVFVLIGAGIGGYALYCRSRREASV